LYNSAIKHLERKERTQKHMEGRERERERERDLLERAKFSRLDTIEYFVVAKRERRRGEIKNRLN